MIFTLFAATAVAIVVIAASGIKDMKDNDNA